MRAAPTIAVLLACASAAPALRPKATLREFLAPSALLAERQGEAVALRAVPLPPQGAGQWLFRNDLAALFVVGIDGVFEELGRSSRVSRALARKATVDLAHACPLPDPAALVAEELAAGAAARFGLRRAASARGGEEPAPGSALQLTVATRDFVLEDDVRWAGEAILRGPDGRILWSEACSEKRAAWTLRELQVGCGGAREDLSDLAHHCASELLGRLAAEHASGRPLEERY